MKVTFGTLNSPSTAFARRTSPLFGTLPEKLGKVLE